MKPPAIEIKLILSAPGMGWEFVARKCGETIAASDGDGRYRPRQKNRRKRRRPMARCA
jgi:hypothetical protein